MAEVLSGKTVRCRGSAHALSLPAFSTLVLAPPAQPASRWRAGDGSAPARAKKKKKKKKGPKKKEEEEEGRTLASAGRTGVMRLSTALAERQLDLTGYILRNVLPQAKADIAEVELGMTIFHPVGTAKMGLESDPEAVLDPRLKVHGLAGLCVADASTMPVITSGNTNSPTMMIAEIAAEMIQDDWL